MGQLNLPPFILGGNPAMFDVRCFDEQNNPVPYTYYDRPGVYAIYHSTTGSIYIGESINVLKRLTDHIDTLKINRHSNRKLQRIWNEYGDDNGWEFYLLERVSAGTKSKRDKYIRTMRETKWIRHYLADLEFRVCNYYLHSPSGRAEYI